MRGLHGNVNQRSSHVTRYLDTRPLRSVWLPHGILTRPQNCMTRHSDSTFTDCGRRFTHHIQPPKVVQHACAQTDTLKVQRVRALSTKLTVLTWSHSCKKLQRWHLNSIADNEHVIELKSSSLITYRQSSQTNVKYPCRRIKDWLATLQSTTVD